MEVRRRTVPRPFYAHPDAGSREFVAITMRPDGGTKTRADRYENRKARSLRMRVVVCRGKKLKSIAGYKDISRARRAAVRRYLRASSGELALLVLASKSADYENETRHEKSAGALYGLFERERERGASRVSRWDCTACRASYAYRAIIPRHIVFSNRSPLHLVGSHVCCTDCLGTRGHRR